MGVLPEQNATKSAHQHGTNIIICLNYSLFCKFSSLNLMNDLSFTGRCDRILWYGRGLKQIRYDRCESRLSDHRPVRTAFTTEVDVLRNSSSLGGFLMSDKLDEYVENFSFQFVEKNEEEINGRKSL